MAPIGSVFLGDSTRARILSISTPPTSPPPQSMSSFTGLSSSSASPPSFTQSDTRSESDVKQDGETSSSGQPLWSDSISRLAQVDRPPQAKPINPEVALELRLRWLEALLVGAGKDARDVKRADTIMKTAEDIQHRLDVIVQGNDGLKRFMEHYDQHAHLLTPPFALSGVLREQAAHETMSDAEIDAFLAEMEPDIRAADRDMREIEILEKKGVTGPGHLAEYEALQPRLRALLQAQGEDAAQLVTLERRIARLMEQNSSQIDLLSDLFVAWDEALTSAESQTSRLENDLRERQRLGLV